MLGALMVTASILPTGDANAASEWSGPYAGINLSFSDAETTIQGNRFTYNQSQAVNFVEHGYQGATLGLFTGWNWQRGAIVYGGELSLGVGQLNSKLVFNSDNDIDQVKIDWSGALVGRIGYAHKNSQYYVKAGVAFANIRNVGGDVNGGTLTLSDAHMREDITEGPTVSFGFESFVAYDWLVRVEISQINFEEYSQANEDGAPGSQIYHVNNGPIKALGIGLIHKL